jgi:hypothetical protein
MRRSTKTWLGLLPAAVAVAFVACGGRTTDEADEFPLLRQDGGQVAPTPSPTTDAGPTPKPDAGGGDASPDATPIADASVDATENDASDGDVPDAISDGGPPDVMLDVMTDVSVDVTPDVAPDVAMDVAMDVFLDVAPDVEPDVAVDAPDDVVDAGVDAAEDAPDDVAVDVTEDVTVDAPADAKFDVDIFDVLPIPDSGPIAVCATCVQDKCGDQVNTCVNTPACAQGLACSVQKCIVGGGGGPPNFQCLLGCFNGNVGALFQAVGAFQCIAAQCGNDCLGAINGDGGAPPPPADAAAGAFIEIPPAFPGLEPGTIAIPPMEAFACWPEVASSAK